MSTKTEKELLLDQLAELRLKEDRLRLSRPRDFFKPLPGGQSSFWHSKLKEKWLFGGNQSGKTTVMAARVDDSLSKNPRYRWYLGSTSMDRSRKVIQKKFWDSVNKDDLDPRAKYREDKGFPEDTCLYKNGSVVYFLSYEMEVDKWAGDTVNGVGFDEEPPWEHFKESQKRVAILDGEIIGAMTALKSYTKLVNRVYMSGNPAIGIFMVPLHENNVRVGGAFTDERIREIIEQTPEEDRPSRIYGIPTFKTGLVYKDWNDKYPWVIPTKDEFAIPQHWPRYSATDPHAHTNQAALWIAVSPTGQHYAYDEIWEAMLIPDLAREIRKRNTPIDTEVNLIDNHYSTQKNAETGKTIKELLFEYGDILTIGGCDDAIARIDMVKTWDRINPVTRLPRLQTFQSCEQTRWERKRYEWETPISERVAERRDPKQKPKKKKDHLMNCLEYLAAHGGVNGLPFVDPPQPDYIQERARAHEAVMHDEAPDPYGEESYSFAGTINDMYL